MDKQGIGEKGAKVGRGLGNTREPVNGAEQRVTGWGGTETGKQARRQGSSTVEGLWPQHGQCGRLSRGGLWA